REETDCSSDALCSNTYGSYECNCKEGFVDVNSETPGRNCEEPALASNTSWTHVSTESVSNVHILPHVTVVPVPEPIQGVYVKNAVRVLCEIEKVIITIQKLFLQQESIPQSSLYLGEPHCNVSFSNNTHVILRTGWNECGTEVQSNMTHTIVKTILRNDISSKGIIHHLKIVSPIHCDLHGSGHFVTEMQLFIGNSPIPQNFTVSASDDILIEVGIQKKDSKLKVVISECWATPTSNSFNPLSFPFINDSCPVPHTYTTVIENGISSKAKFKLKIFSFVNNSVVYLHCKIRICVETLASTCKTNCNGFRTLRTGETIATHRTSWGPLCKSSGELQKAPGLGVGYIVLIVIAVFVFILGVAAILVFQYQRKTGRYNFKIKSDNFSYQVFYD
uniref:ZP domain-containing protein n=1 Tax=Sphenodon punctatus TaxID=8508 RepID=A0A8D0HCI9_SPHPU